MDSQEFLEKFYSVTDGRVLCDSRLRERSLDELYTMVDLELAHRQAPTVLVRVHRRLCKLRAREERKALARLNPDWRR